MKIRRWWLVTGSVLALSVALYGSYASWALDEFSGSVAAALDWFAVGVIYFFLGALLGLAVDWWRGRKKWTVKNVPDWAWLTAGLWLFGIIGGYVLTSPPYNHLLLLIFPLAYGVFFVGTAFTILFPSIVTPYAWGKPLLDVLFLGAFAGWFILAWHNKKNTLWWRRALLFLIFFVLIIGVAGCLKQMP